LLPSPDDVDLLVVAEAESLFEELDPESPPDVVVSLVDVDSVTDDLAEDFDPERLSVL
jgi:hypothetical protein